MTRRFKQVDVFTDRPFMGNPVAVVLDAEGLATDEMQRIAGWTNLSETTFVLPSRRADYRLRIFTPRQELPFAGHPSIGSAHAVLEAGLVGKGPTLVQECLAGNIELSLDEGAIFLRGPQPKITPLANVASALGIPLAPASPLLQVDVGPVWLVGEMTDAAALAALTPDMTALAEWTRSLAATGVSVFAASRESSSAIHVRSFAPAQGIPEDPVCGSGNLCVAAYLRNNRDRRFGTAYVARQGMQLGRDGRVSVRIAADRIDIGGRAVTCVEGVLKSA
jgi:PhzF family phenazine biosynthesis protein